MTTIYSPPAVSRPTIRRLPDFEPGAAPSPIAEVPAPPAAAPPEPVAPDVRPAALAVLRLLLEVVDGRRPHTQLGQTVSEPVRRYVLAAAGRAAGPHGPRATLTTARVYQPCPTSAELSAVWRLGRRPRALAARIERHPPAPLAWRCTALRLG